VGAKSSGTANREGFETMLNALFFGGSVQRAPCLLFQPSPLLRQTLGDKIQPERRRLSTKTGEEKMPYFDSQGVKIYYEIDGSGPEVIMVHGFAANMEANWKQPRVAEALRAENRLIMMDCRGHGKSDKPRDPAMYGDKMLDDITNLMDYLGIRKANFLGYSMGARLSFGLLLTQPERFKSVILGGFTLADAPPPGAKAGAPFQRDVVVKALLADSINQVTDPVGREFRRFAESTKADLKALAACMMGTMEQEARWLADAREMMRRIKSISVPLMTILGNDDFLPGDKSRMAMLVPDGCHFLIQGKDHLTVVADPKFRMAVRAFLNYVNGR
jgi:pimeloyl-ACP methyl ester carboxylesterase